MAYNDAKTCRQCGELIVFGQHTCPPRWTVILETAYVRPFDDARGQVLRCSVDIRKVLTYECSRAQTVRP